MDLFVPLSVEFASDDKIIESSVLAEHLFVRALAFCKRALNDGRFTGAQMRRECDKISKDEVEMACAELVQLGLFVVTDSGYEIPSWLKRNPSRAALEATKERARLAGVQGNHERWHISPKGKPKASCELCFPQVNRPPDGVPESGCLATPIAKTEGRQREGKTEGRELTTSTKASCNTQEEPETIEASESGASEIDQIIKGRITNPLNPLRLMGAVDFATRTHPRPKVLDVARNAIGKALAEQADDPIGYAMAIVTAYATEPTQPVAGDDKTRSMVIQHRDRQTDPPPANLRQGLQ